MSVAVEDIVVLSDFDGTITVNDTSWFVLQRFAEGNWSIFDEKYDRGEISLEECIRRQFSLVKASKKQILSELERVTTFRPYFDKLIDYCRIEVFPLVVASAGLDFVIRHFLRLRGTIRRRVREWLTLAMAAGILKPSKTRTFGSPSGTLNWLGCAEDKESRSGKLTIFKR